MVSLTDFLNFLLQAVNSEAAVVVSARENGRIIHVDLAGDLRLRAIAEVGPTGGEATLRELRPVAGEVARIRFGGDQGAVAEGNLELVDRAFGAHPERPNLN